MAITFKDCEGREWAVRLTLGVINRAVSETRITLADLQAQKIEIKDLISVLWFAIEKQARERKMSRADFEDSMTLAEIKTAGLALAESFKAAMPSAEDQEDGSGPLAKAQAENPAAP